MKFQKKELSELARCYAVADTVVQGKEWLLFATEGKGKCIGYSFPGLEETTVWEGPGGTMGMVPIPGKNGDFLAVQNFFPTFDSAEASIVWAMPDKRQNWKVETLLNLPYVHRFDILSVGNTHYFIGATLCTSKQFRDDWSDPGKIYAGKLPETPEDGIELTVIQEGLIKNHGYTRAELNGGMSGIIACENGVYAVTPPPQLGEEWRIEQLMRQACSDIAVVDIDGDGENELVTIEPFHGEFFRIYKKYDREYKIIYEYPRKMDFAHVVWGGALCGRPAVIGGYRREGKELFAVTCVDPKRLLFHTQTIDRGTGPSNVHVIHQNGQDIILSANREIGQVALYYVTEE